MPRKAIELVMEEHAKSLMSIHGVIGIAVGKSHGKQCIRVFVVQKNNELLQQIPSSLGGYPLIVEQRGQFRALST